MLLCTNGERGESDNDIESADNDEFFCGLFNQSEPKKDATAKRIEGFLSVVLAKKIDDNSFANAALKKLFILYNTSLPTGAAVERLFSTGGVEDTRLEAKGTKKSEAKDSPSEDRPSRGQ